MIGSCILLLQSVASAQWNPEEGDAAIEMQVIDDQSKPIAGVRILMVAEPRWGWDGKHYEFVTVSHSTATDKDGRFKFDPCGGVQYWIGVHPAGEPVALFSRDRQSLRDPGGLTIQLESLRTVQGSLKDADGNVLGNHRVFLHDDALPETFLAPLLPPGCFLMECEDVGYSVAMNGPTGQPFEQVIQSCMTDNAGVFEFRVRAQSVTVAAVSADGAVHNQGKRLQDPVESLNWRFVKLGKGTCSVVDGSGDPIEGAAVFVARAASWGDHSILCPVGLTDAAGQVTYTAVKGDMSGLAIRHPDGLRWMVDDFHSERFEDAGSIRFSEDSLAPTIHVRVVDEKGATVSAPRFRIAPAGSSLPSLAPSTLVQQLVSLPLKPDAEGVFEVTASAEAFFLVDSVEHAAAFLMPADSEETEPFVVSLHPGRRITLSVTEAGRPVAGAAVAPEFHWGTDEDQEALHESCNFASELFWQEILTDRDGNWTSPLVCASAPFDLQIQHWDGRMEVVRWPFEDRLQVRFSDNLAEVHGLLLQGGVPLAGCEITIEERLAHQSGPSVRVRVEADGSFSARVHNAVDLELSIDDHPQFRQSWRMLSGTFQAGDLGTIEVNDRFLEAQPGDAVVRLRFPQAQDGVRLGVHLEMDPADDAHPSARSGRIHAPLFVNDSGSASMRVPAGQITITLDWPGQRFRSRHDYFTDSSMAAKKTLVVNPGEDLDLSAVAEAMYQELLLLRAD